MKKLLAVLALPVVMLLGVVAMPTPAVEAQNFASPNPYTAPQDGGSTDNVWVVGAGTSTGDGLVSVIKWVINWALGILAFLALIVLLYGGFLMVTAAGDTEKYDKWFTILKQAAIGLVLIGVAWFVVSIIFWLINLVATNAWPAGTEG